MPNNYSMIILIIKASIFGGIMLPRNLVLSDRNHERHNKIERTQSAHVVLIPKSHS